MMAARRHNPPLVTFLGALAGNPPKTWRKIAAHVQAICYVHAQDGKCYVHGFGNHDPSTEELKSGKLDMAALKTRTDVEAFWSPDKSQVLLKQKHGEPLVGLFD